MKIDEAIKIKEKFRRERCYDMTALEIGADNLSIEALKRLQKLRTYEYFRFQDKLEGETKE